MNFPNPTSFPGLLVDKLSISDPERAFADVNRFIWNQNTTSADGTILTDTTLKHPGYVMSAGIAGSLLADELDLNVTFLTGNYNRGLIKILNSYNPLEMIKTSDRYRHPRIIKRALTETRRIYRDLEAIDDLINLRYGDILIGDLVYNTYLSGENVGTMNSVSRSVLPYIFDSLLYYYYYQHVIDTKDVRAILAAQGSYTACGTLLRLGIKHNLSTFERIFGPKKFTIRRLKQQSQVEYQSNRPDPEIFEYIWEEYREDVIDETDTYFERRLCGADEDVVVSKAYSKSKAKIDRKGLADKINIDPEKPIVVIMSHVFVDAGHYTGGLFRDYVTWLRETLHHIRTQKQINWIVKPHPGAERHSCEHTVVDEYTQAVEGFNDHTVRLLPNNISTSAVHDFADAVITVRGSAGIEFPALGTPAIVAGESHYTGFGFTREPTSKQEYFELLDDIDGSISVTDTEQDRARVMTYLLFILMRVPSERVPEMPKTKVNNADTIWDRGADLLSDAPAQDTTFADHVSTFIQDDHRHVLRYDAIGL
jgi:hypothetical protein